MRHLSKVTLTSVVQNEPTMGCRTGIFYRMYRRQLIKYVKKSDVKLAPLVESSDKENLDLQILIKDQDDLKMASFTQEHIYCITDVNFPLI
ncbi:uncharacterized protein LOC144659504 isoform X2 [Oculina patagonica]